MAAKVKATGDYILKQTAFAKPLIPIHQRLVGATRFWVLRIEAVLFAPVYRVDMAATGAFNRILAALPTAPLCVERIKLMRRNRI